MAFWLPCVAKPHFANCWPCMARSWSWLVCSTSARLRALMLAVCFISLLVELLNSAIEAVVDRISLERHPLSKNAKDMGSAAQTTALLMVGAVWTVVLLG